jgi:ribosome maturation factor RimP
MEVKLDPRVEEIIEDELALLGFELVMLEGSLAGKRKVIRLYIDHPEKGVTVDDCVIVTRTIGLVLDNEDLIKVPYNLEVSSPGMNRPLAKPEHFSRFKGKTAKVVIIDEEGSTTTRIGEIVDVAEESIIISVEGSEEEIPFEKISKANLHGEKWKVTGPKRAEK